ncbi:MAG: hypothetical protein D3916_02040 [Candidatus Electrothrix sp. MAN1_4]|nr:hypothetical protein [Candidatus Electrothrix sp. MAN1_4]
MKTTETITRIGLVGCGHISDDYLKTNASADRYEIVACADIIKERAHEKAKQYNVPKVCGIEELIRDPEIDLVLLQLPLTGDGHRCALQLRVFPYIATFPLQ